MYNATYFDGKQSTPHEAKIAVEADGIFITLVSTGESVIWLYDRIAKYQQQGTITTVYYGEKIPYGSIIVEDLDFLPLLEKYGKNAPFLKNVHRTFERLGKWTYAVAFATIIGFLVFSNYVLFPFLSDVASENVPITIEKDWGDEFFHTFVQFNDIDSVKSSLLTNFADDLDFESNYELKFYVIESDIKNAFALPGGRIVVFTGIIEMMDDYDELVALLGHEVGHVVHRHSLKNIFHQYSHQYLLNLLFGNGVDILGAIGQTASQLSLLENSRSAETQADEYGLLILKERSVNAEGMVDLFSALADQYDEVSSSQALEMMSTHPNMKKRITKIKAEITKEPYVYNSHHRLKELFKKLKEEK